MAKIKPKHYDLIVIGSGPGGEKGAASVAFHNKSVAMIEKEPHLGGAAANTGTLPSKTLRETALTIAGLRQRQLQALNYKLTSINVQEFLAQERVVKDYERARVQENVDRHNIRLYRGSATFVDEHTISVTAERCDPVHVSADYFLICTGSYPYRPKDLFPFTNPRIYDSDTILTLHRMPKSLLAVGGGVIGCEYACMFNALGVDVTVVEKRDRLLGQMDKEMSLSLEQHMRSHGIQILMNDEVSAVSDDVQNNVEVEFKRSNDKLYPEAVLVSSGRSGQTSGLGLEKVGIEVNKREQIVVDGHFRTALKNVYAAGDVIGNPALASTAMAQARMAMAHAFKLEFDRGLTELLPTGIFTIPECSSVGETSESLQEKGIDHFIGRAFYGNNARGLIIGDHKGFLKLLFSADDLTLLGVHALGEQAAELVHVGLTAMLCNAKADLFIRTCYNYPTLGELYKYAAYDALGKHKRRRGDAVLKAAEVEVHEEPPSDEGRSEDSVAEENDGASQNSPPKTNKTAAKKRK